MSVIENPYVEPGTPFLKGNLHTHTTESDGTRLPQQMVDDYAARGYDFLMLSDHDHLTEPRRLQNHGLVLIPGNEVSAEGPHLLHVNATKQLAPDADRQKVIDAINQDKGLAIVNHPNWQEHFSHCPQEYLVEWQRYLGLEIYNGVIQRLPGSPLATDRWDMLLGSGRRVWGFGNDDAHHEGEVELAWNMVQTRTRNVASLCDAMARGAFYVSTGVTIETIAVFGDTIHVCAPNAERICLVSDFGARRTYVDDTSFTFHVTSEVKSKYLRVECYGPRETMAWTQPFFLKKA
jgi:hypothetical protein